MKRERVRAGRFVLAGAVVVVLIGVAAAVLLPGAVDLTANSQVTSRTSPTVVDLVAAVATGFAGAVALSRRDVAAVLPGVAIAISLVPPLAVAGVCLGEGSVAQFLGALLLFLSNLVALVLAGTVLFAALGYAQEADAEALSGGSAAADVTHPGHPSRRRARPAGAQHRNRPPPPRLDPGDPPRGGRVGAADPRGRGHGRSVQCQRLPDQPSAPETVVSTHGLLQAVDAVVPSGLAIVLDTTYGEEISVGTTGAP